jgi:hypothetical protein
MERLSSQLKQTVLVNLQTAAIVSQISGNIQVAHDLRFGRDLDPRCGCNAEAEVVYEVGMEEQHVKKSH